MPHRRDPAKAVLMLDLLSEFFDNGELDPRAGGGAMLRRPFSLSEDWPGHMPGFCCAPRPPAAAGYPSFTSRWATSP